MFKLPQKPNPRRPAFTLVELLIVIAIIGILMAMLFPAINAVRSSSRATSCRANLRQLGMGVIQFTQQHDGQLPAQWKTARTNPWENFSWVVDVLPFIEQQNVRDALDLEAAPLDVANRKIVSVSIPIFECPATPGSPRKISELGTVSAVINAGARDYVAIHSIIGPDGTIVLPGIWNGGADSTEIFSDRTPEFDTASPGHGIATSPNRSVYTYRAHLTQARDGLSNTALLVEQAGKPDYYGLQELKTGSSQEEGAWSTCDLSAFTGDGVNKSNENELYAFHGSASVIMADGSVHAWDESIEPRVLRALMSRIGGEIISDDDWR